MSNPFYNNYILHNNNNNNNYNNNNNNNNSDNNNNNNNNNNNIHHFYLIWTANPASEGTGLFFIWFDLKWRKDPCLWQLSHGSHASGWWSQLSFFKQYYITLFILILKEWQVFAFGCTLTSSIRRDVFMFCCLDVPNFCVKIPLPWVSEGRDKVDIQRMSSTNWRSSVQFIMMF